MTELRYTVDDARLREVLDAEIARAGTQTALAKKLGVSLVYINDVVRGRRSIAALAPRLGFHTLTVHVPDDGTPPITAAEAARLIDGLRRRRTAGATP
jgi:hypothetical protein